MIRPSAGAAAWGQTDADGATLITLAPSGRGARPRAKRVRYPTAFFPLSGAQTAANYKSVWKPESKPSLSSHLTGYINDGKFESTCLVAKSN